LLTFCFVLCKWAIPFNIRTPLSRIHVFHSYTPEEFQAQNFYPWRIPKFQAQNPLPLKNSKLKTFNPWRIPSSEKFQSQTSLPLKNSKLKTLYPWRIPSSKHFTPEDFQVQNPLPLKNSRDPRQGGTDIKWNGPNTERFKNNLLPVYMTAIDNNHLL
jgi:hypothetical protein